MLAIRLKRLGRKGYPTYRIIIQESQRHPSSGRVVAYVGHYNPHTKEYQLDKDQIEAYLKNGAQPSPRVVKLLLDAKVKLPDWVEKPQTDKQGKTRFADKLRKNRPEEAEKPAETAATDGDEPSETSPEAEPTETETAAATEEKTAEKTEPTETEASEASAAGDSK